MHFIFNNFYSKIWGLWDNLKENMVESGRPQMTIWHMRIACWVTKATETLKICNTYCFSTTTMVKRTRFIVTLLLIAYIV